MQTDKGHPKQSGMERGRRKMRIHRGEVGRERRDGQSPNWSQVAGSQAVAMLWPRVAFVYPSSVRSPSTPRSSQRDQGVRTTSPRLCPPGSDRPKMGVMPLVTTGQALPSMHHPTTPPSSPGPSPHSHFSIFTATFRTASSLPRPKAVASTTFPKAPAPRVLPAKHRGSFGPWAPKGPFSKGHWVPAAHAAL